MNRGAYRVVFCFEKYAIKIPRITRFRKGLRSNRWEVEVWKVWRKKLNWDHLCPVLFSDPLSLVVVMNRAELTASSEEIRFALENEYDYHPSPNIESKPENWGVLSGKLVCFDYGLEELDDIERQRIEFQNGLSN